MKPLFLTDHQLLLLRSSLHLQLRMYENPCGLLVDEILELKGLYEVVTQTYFTSEQVDD